MNNKKTIISFLLLISLVLFCLYLSKYNSKSGFTNISRNLITTNKLEKVQSFQKFNGEPYRLITNNSNLLIIDEENVFLYNNINKKWFYWNFNG